MQWGHRALHVHSANQVALSKIHANTAADVLHAHSGVVADDFHVAAQFADVEIPEAPAAFHCGAARYRNFEVRREGPIAGCAILVGPDDYELILIA